MLKGPDLTLEEIWPWYIGAVNVRYDIQSTHPLALEN